MSEIADRAALDLRLEIAKQAAAKRTRDAAKIEAAKRKVIIQAEELMHCRGDVIVLLYAPQIALRLETTKHAISGDNQEFAVIKIDDRHLDKIPDSPLAINFVCKSEIPRPGQPEGPFGKDRDKLLHAALEECERGDRMPVVFVVSGRYVRPDSFKTLMLYSYPLATKNTCTRHGCMDEDESKERMKCSRCAGVYYCSTECQRLDWPVHRAECEATKKMLALANTCAPQLRKLMR